MDGYSEGGTATSVTQPVSSDCEGHGTWPPITQLPTDTLFLVDLTIESTAVEPRFKRILVSSPIDVLDLINAPETTDFNVTALQGRSVDSPGALVRTVTKLDVLPPSLVLYTLDSGDQFVVVSDGEPRQVTTCFDLGSD